MKEEETGRVVPEAKKREEVLPNRSSYQCFVTEFDLNIIEALLREELGNPNYDSIRSASDILPEENWPDRTKGMIWRVGKTIVVLLRRHDGFTEVYFRTDSSRPKSVLAKQMGRLQRRDPIWFLRVLFNGNSEKSRLQSIDEKYSNVPLILTIVSSVLAVLLFFVGPRLPAAELLTPVFTLSVALPCSTFTLLYKYAKSISSIEYRFASIAMFREYVFVCMPVIIFITVVSLSTKLSTGPAFVAFCIFSFVLAPAALTWALNTILGARLSTFADRFWNRLRSDKPYEANQMEAALWYFVRAAGLVAYLVTEGCGLIVLIIVYAKSFQSQDLAVPLLMAAIYAVSGLLLSWRSREWLRNRIRYFISMQVEMSVEIGKWRGLTHINSLEHVRLSWREQR